MEVTVARSLVRELQSDANDPSQSLATVLRKARVLATRLRHEGLKLWAQRELEGYPDKDSVPDYRKVRADHRGDFIGPFGSGAKNYPLPLEALMGDSKDVIEHSYITFGVSQIEEALKGDGEAIAMPWSQGMVQVIGKHVKMNNGGVLVSAHELIPKNALVGIVDTIRTRLLDFLLEIEERFPEAANDEVDAAALPAKEMGAVFNTIVLGDRNVVASGQDLRQVALVDVRVGDGDALLAFLRNQVGVPDADLADLKRLIADSPRAPGSVPGAVSKWLGNAVQRIATGGWELCKGIGKDAAVGLVTKGVLRYFGVEG